MPLRIIKICIFLISVFILSIFLYYNYFKNEKEVKVQKENTDEITYKSNIINDVNYSSKDARGNEYIVKARTGEIDYNKTNIIFLTDVVAYIKLKNKETIIIKSNFGKYNLENFDTIFSKNVMVNYLENNINSDYLDFSMKRNSMIISKNVIYTNLEKQWNADVAEINLETKDTKISMFEKNKKIKIKNKK